MKFWLWELWHYRELLLALTAREVKIRYKQTLLGASWAILQPLSLTLIFTFVFSVMLKVDSVGVAYPVFAYSALVPWTFFSNSVSFGSLSVVNNGNLVTKVYFPREILPLSSIGAALFDFLMAGIVFVLILIYYQVPITLNFLLIFLIIPSIVILTAGISFFFSAINVMFRDIRFIIPLILQIWLYLTPVIYSTTQVPQKYQVFFHLNPLVGLIEDFREATIYAKTPDMTGVLASFVFSILIFILGYSFFKSKEKIFADII